MEKVPSATMITETTIAWTLINADKRMSILDSYLSKLSIIFVNFFSILSVAFTK